MLASTTHRRSVGQSRRAYCGEEAEGEYAQQTGFTASTVSDDNELPEQRVESARSQLGG